MLACWRMIIKGDQPRLSTGKDLSRLPSTPLRSERQTQRDSHNKELSMEIQRFEHVSRLAIKIVASLAGTWLFETAIRCVPDNEGIMRVRGIEAVSCLG